MKYLMSLLIIMFAQPALAFKFTPEVCKSYGLGSNWYCEEERPQEETAYEILNASLLPEEKAVMLGKLVDRQLKRATITHDPNDIKAYLETHHLITEKGVEFARLVQRTLETEPRFSSSESYIKNVAEREIKESERESILTHARERYGLVFIFHPDCPHCRHQMPILASLKAHYGIKILGISPEEEDVPFLDEFILNEAIAKDPMVKAYPTILLLDRERPGKIFLAKGLTSEDRLEDLLVMRILERESRG